MQISDLSEKPPSVLTRSNRHNGHIEGTVEFPFPVQKKIMKIKRGSWKVVKMTFIHSKGDCFFL